MGGGPQLRSDGGVLLVFLRAEFNVAEDEAAVGPERPQGRDKVGIIELVQSREDLYILRLGLDGSQPTIRPVVIDMITRSREGRSRSRVEAATSRGGILPAATGAGSTRQKCGYVRVRPSGHAAKSGQAPSGRKGDRLSWTGRTKARKR